MHIILGYAFDGGSFPDALGEAVHGFLVQDNPEQCLEIRMAQALAICTRWDVTGIAPGDLVAASDRLIAFLRDTYGDGTALKEHPMHLKVPVAVGNQVASGWIDLVWQTRDGSVIVDHKSFLGRSETVKKHCTAFVPCAEHAKTAG